jgi:hypothetical protein
MSGASGEGARSVDEGQGHLSEGHYKLDARPRFLICEHLDSQVIFFLISSSIESLQWNERFLFIIALAFAIASVCVTYFILIACICLGVSGNIMTIAVTCISSESKQDDFFFVSLVSNFCYPFFLVLNVLDSGKRGSEAAHSKSEAFL